MHSCDLKLGHLAMPLLREAVAYYEQVFYYDNEDELKILLLNCNINLKHRIYRVQDAF